MLIDSGKSLPASSALICSRYVARPEGRAHKGHTAVRPKPCDLGSACRAASTSTTFVLTATTLIYARGAGITAAAGTRLALQSLLTQSFRLGSFQLGHIARAPHCYVLSLPHTRVYWVICAPAAFLGCKSRVSCSFSGIEL